MQILIAEDEAASRLVLEKTLKSWDYDVVSTVDGNEAWEVLRGEDSPQLAILDWMMPNMDGVEVCRLVRSEPSLQNLYLIMLTALDTADNIVEALDAGANDYIAKPFDRKELQARIRVGVRVVELQNALAQRVRELEDSIAREKRLQELVPICSYCKNIRDDQNYWQRVERYIEEHTGAAFSHSICPDCYEKIVQPELDAFSEQLQSEKGAVDSES
ncbi:MAG: response regulator transcription factor [Gemmatimonadetes bacterium]|nr:response regulator transcription factor [Gemmatimonadota bacterium]